MTKLIRPALGLLQGCIIYLLFNFTNFNIPSKVSLAFLLTFPLFALQIKLPKKNTMGLALSILAALTIVFSLYAYYLLNSLTSIESFFTTLVAVQCSISAFIFYIFYCVAAEEGRISFCYSALFSESWQVILKLFFGNLLVLLICKLFSLAALLFISINMDIIHQIVISNEFFYIMIPFFFGISMTILSDHEDILTQFRDILLAFCKVLYPIFIVISLSFLLISPFTNIPFVEFWKIMPFLSLINILLFNGIYQGGLDKAPYSPILCKLIYANMFIAFGFSLYLLKFPLATVHSLGLKPDSFLIITYLSIIAIYHLFYCLAVLFSKKPWLSMLKILNTIMALFIATLFLLLALPWFNQWAIQQYTMIN